MLRNTVHSIMQYTFVVKIAATSMCPNYPCAQVLAASAGQYTQTILFLVYTIWSTVVSHFIGSCEYVNPSWQVYNRNTALSCRRGSCLCRVLWCWFVYGNTAIISSCNLVLYSANALPQLWLILTYWKSPYNIASYDHSSRFNVIFRLRWFKA